MSEDNFQPLSPTPRRWTSGGSPFEPSTQSVIDDVERMLAGLDRSPIQSLTQSPSRFPRSTPTSPTPLSRSHHSRTASEPAERGRSEQRDSFYTALESIPAGSTESLASSPYPSRPSPTSRPSFPPPKLRTLHSTSERDSFYTAFERPSSFASRSDSGYAGYVTARQSPLSTPTRTKALGSSPLKRASRSMSSPPSPPRSRTTSERSESAGQRDRVQDHGKTPSRNSSGSSVRSRSSPPGSRKGGLGGDAIDEEGDTPRARLFGPRIAHAKSSDSLSASYKALPLAPALPTNFATIGPSTPRRHVSPFHPTATPTRTPGKASNLIAFFEQGGQVSKDTENTDSGGIGPPAYRSDTSPVKVEKGKGREMDLADRLKESSSSAASSVSFSTPPPLPPRPRAIPDDNVFISPLSVNLHQPLALAPDLAPIVLPNPTPTGPTITTTHTVTTETIQVTPLVRGLSPKRSVRSIVAAWRGRLASGSKLSSRRNDGGQDAALTMAESTMDSMHTPMLAIRRQSTRRRQRPIQEEATEGILPSVSEASHRPSNPEQRDRMEYLSDSPPMVPPKPSGDPNRPRTLEEARADDRVRGRLVSTFSDVNYEPIRLGQLWYLNVHDPERGPHWIACDATLYADRVVLSWEAEARGSRGFVTLDLVHCSEVRSIPSPNHPSAAGDIGSTAARALAGVDLYPFQLVYEDGVERLACESARDRVRWVSAIWEVLERLPEIPESDADDEVRSDIGSQSTIMALSPISTAFPRPPRRSEPSDGWRSNFRGSFGQRSSHQPVIETLDLADGLFRHSSTRLGGGRGSMLRRTTSVSDIHLAPPQAIMPSPPLWSRRSHLEPAMIALPSSQSSSTRPVLAGPWTPVAGSMIEPEGNRSVYVGVDETRTSSVRKAIAADGKSTWAGSMTSTEHIARTSEVITATSTGDITSTAGTFVTASAQQSRPSTGYFDPIPSNTRSMEVLSVVSEAVVDVNLERAMTELSSPGVMPGSIPWTPLARRPVVKGRLKTSETVYSAQGQPSSATFEKDARHLEHESGVSATLRWDQSAASSASTERGYAYKTASDGGQSHMSTAESRSRAGGYSEAPSSLSGKTSFLEARSSVGRDSQGARSNYASSASGLSIGFLDARTNSSQSVATVSALKTASSERVPVPSFPSSGPSSSSGSYSESTSGTELSGSTATARQHVTLEWLANQASNNHAQALHTLREQEALRLRNAGHVDGQLGRMETALADISSFLARKPPPVPDKIRQPPSPSLSHGSDSSGSTGGIRTPPLPATELGGIRSAVDALREHTQNLAEKQSLTNDMLARGFPGQALELSPQYNRLEDLLLRLLERTGDSEAGIERGLDIARPGVHRGRRQDAHYERDHTQADSLVYGDRLSDTDSLGPWRGKDDFRHGTDTSSLRAGPPPTMNTMSERSRHRYSGVPSSLLAPSPRVSSELDEEWEMGNLPTGNPAGRYQADQTDQARRGMPPMGLLQSRMIGGRGGPPLHDEEQPTDHEATGFEPSGDELRDALSPSDESSRPSRLETSPIARIDQDLPSPPSERSGSSSSDETPRMRRFQAGPPPRPVNIPSPVQAMGRPNLMSSMRPFPPPLPMGSLPRNRLAGTREPLTTTYFRRGFPPGGPGMGMGMPGMIGPHLGPFASSLPGFGGPFGPNVFPRPGYMPPGFAGGAYGIPRRPVIPPMPQRRLVSPEPLSPSSRSDTESSYLTTTPTTAVYEVPVAPMAPPIPQKDSLVETLQEVQGQQANEISRYLNDLSQVLDTNRQHQQNELLTLHEDISRIRDQLNHPSAQHPVIVQTPHGDQVILSDEPVLVVPQPAAAVLNISENSEYGSPVHAAPPLPSKKDYEQDRVLADLQHRVADVMSQNSIADDLVRERVEETQRELADEIMPIGRKRHHIGPDGSAGVRFAPSPEHVMETTTEVIRGPAGADGIERTTVRTYDRTGSEIMDDLPPAVIHEEVTEIITGPPGSHVGSGRGQQLSDIPVQAPSSVAPYRDTSTEILQGPARTSHIGSGTRPTVVVQDVPDQDATERIEVVQDPKTGIQTTTITRKPGHSAGSVLPHHTAPPSVTPYADGPFLDPGLDPGSRYPSATVQEDPGYLRPATHRPSQTHQNVTRVPMVAPAPAEVMGDIGDQEVPLQNDIAHDPGTLVSQPQAKLQRPAKVGVLREQPVRPSVAPIVASLPPAVENMQPQQFADVGDAPGHQEPNIVHNVPQQTAPMSVIPPSQTGTARPGPGRRPVVTTVPSRLGPAASEQNIGRPSSNDGGRISHAPGGQTMQSDPVDHRHDTQHNLGDVQDTGGPASTHGHSANGGQDVRVNEDVRHPAGRKGNVLRKPSQGGKSDQHYEQVHVLGDPQEADEPVTQNDHAPDESHDVRIDEDLGQPSGKKGSLLRKPSQGSKIKEKIRTNTSRPGGDDTERDDGNGKVRFEHDERHKEDLSAAPSVSVLADGDQDATGPGTIAHDGGGLPTVVAGHGPQSMPTNVGHVAGPPSIIHSTGRPGKTTVLESGNATTRPQSNSGSRPQVTEVVHGDAHRVDGDVGTAGPVFVEEDEARPSSGRSGKLVKQRPSKHGDILRDRPTKVTSDVPIGAEDTQPIIHVDGDVLQDGHDGDGGLGGGLLRKGKPGASNVDVKSKNKISGSGASKPLPVRVEGGNESTHGDMVILEDATPEAAMSERDRIKSKAKAKTEEAERERLDNERILREKQEAANLASVRHMEHTAALADLKRALDAQATDEKQWKSAYADDAKGRENRRTDKVTRDKQWQEALDKLIVEKEADKKWRDGQAKQPGVKDIIDYLKKDSDDRSAFLRSLAADIVAQNANQHQLTQQAAKAWAKEQVGFNLAGYLDDFSKALSSEVRALLKEVGDLRETRRALYYELAELLLMKGRQSSGDLMAVMPWPGPAANRGPAAAPAAPKAPPPGGGCQKAAPPPPQMAPAWQSFNVPPSMSIGGPAIAQTPSNPGGSGKKAPPPAGGSRPLPVPGDVTITTTTTTAAV